MAFLDLFRPKKTKIVHTPKEVTLLSTITCPHCGHKKQETMPEDACQFFYECESCHEVIKPLEGDCCVYCSYGSEKCPPIQKDESCC
ncbi:MAG: hypothetical protein IIA45_06420 [Bacteroidetes bacterium]|nr:hypothetical protein [Bacteroidota bacterium]